jgi:hypothetical protein
MRCTNCDHVLWNQPVPPAGTGRVCSECGTAYTAADFSFGRGKVRFCCPQCDTGYYGTSRAGHLEPAQFQCVGCGLELTMDACVIRPHDLSREVDAMQRTEVPWLSHRGEGALRRWWSTCTLGIGGSAGLPAMLSQAPRPGAAVRFLLINAVVAVVLGSLLSFGFGLLPVVTRGGAFGGSVLEMIGAAIAGVVLGTLGMVVVAAVPAALTQFIRRRGQPIGFPRAFELVCYSSGALLLSLVPCCGFTLGYFCWMVAGAQALASAVDTRGDSVGAAILAIVGFLIAAAIPIGMFIFYA